MNKNIVIGIIVCLGVIIGGIFYLRNRPEAKFDLKGIVREENELGGIESSISSLANDEVIFAEIDETLSDVSEAISSTEALKETTLTDEGKSADLSSDLANLIADEQAFKEVDQALDELTH